MEIRQHKTLGAAGPPPRKPTKFRIPKQVEIIGQLWSVEVHPQWDSGVLGDCDYTNHRIRINDRCSPSTAVEVFLHELLHAILAAMGALVGIEDETEERIVSALAPGLWDTFRRNGFRFA